MGATFRKERRFLRRSLTRSSIVLDAAGAKSLPLVALAGADATVEMALARGKRTYDKRHDLAQRDAAREAERAFRRRG